jgi:SAM-dependent methyltransferase
MEIPDYVTVPPLRIISVDKQHDLVTAYLNQRAEAGPVQILEAGCGRQWKFDLHGADYTLTGVDLDGDALEARKNRYGDLHEAIVGDLRDIRLKSSTYDVIYNSYVLEHIAGAHMVLDNFLRWLKPDGLLILYIPDPASVYGFSSRITPHWLHVLFYRYILGREHAGKPGNAPYPTHYDDIVSRQGIRAYAHKNDLIIREEFGYYKPGGAIRILMTLMHFVSIGRLASSHCDLVFILEKQPEQASQSSRCAVTRSTSTSL